MSENWMNDQTPPGEAMMILIVQAIAIGPALNVRRLPGQILRLIELGMQQNRPAFFESFFATPVREKSNGQNIVRQLNQAELDFVRRHGVDFTACLVGFRVESGQQHGVFVYIIIQPDGQLRVLKVSQFGAPG